MGGKRGQFTIFVVLGIVLIAAFAFMLFARNIVVQTQLQNKADNIINQVLQTSSIEHYVTSCVNRVTDEAVVRLGLQGGVLYDYQGGIISEGLEGEQFLPFEHNGSVYKVNYGLRINRNNTCFDANPPGYPLWDTDISAVKTAYWLRNGFGANCSMNTGAFGYPELPKLCDPNGPNRHLVSARFNYSCGGNSSYGTNSIQFQLTEYISNKTAECVDFSIFEDVFGYNISVVNKPETIVTFGSSGFTVETFYPFIVKVGLANVESFARFEVKKNYRLKELHEFIVRVLRSEASDYEFALDLDYLNVFGGDDARIQVIVKPNSCFACINGFFDEIVQVIDNASSINGKPFVFQFAVENRIPVLDFIDEGWGSHNIQVMQGFEIDFTPEGYDSDDNLINYSYRGWKENFDSSFNISCCIAASNSASCITCVDDDYSVEPKNWSLSDEFLASKQNASYLTVFEDTGLHHVTIMVEDEEGLKDWQNVSILVFDLPVAVINLSNDYSDIGNGNASKEDPYFLDASLSHSYLSPLESFRWSDDKEPFEITTPDLIQEIPDGGYSIGNIVPLNFFRLGYHNITLEVYSNGMWIYPPDKKEIEVFDCLPHRSAVDSYPYGIEFQSNHTCCSDAVGSWGTITGGNICYEESQFSCRPIQKEYGSASLAIQDDAAGLTSPRLVTITSPIGNFLTDPKLANDIFKRVYTQECSGNRGNVCSGTVTDVWTPETPGCNDFNSSNGETESCQGPCNPFDSNCNNIDCPDFNTGSGCYNYNPGYSFEKDFLSVGTATGICNPNAERSSISNNGYDDGAGWFDCTATCNGGTCNNTRSQDCVCGSYSGFSQCIGIPADDLTPYEDVFSCSGDESYFADHCDNTCSASDRDNICRSTSFDSSCTAAVDCNNRPAGDYWSVSTGNGNKPEFGCSNSCAFQDCSPYIFDTSLGVCKNSGTTANDADCDDGFFRNNDGRCISCTNNIETGGDSFDGLCERHATTCNADTKCDEHPEGYACLPGKTCQSCLCV